MANCKYCHEGDESRLITSTRIISGKAVTIDICLSCFWIEKFRAEAKGEDGNALREGRIEERAFAEPAPSASGMDQID